MAELSVNINNRNYSMECDDGQEHRVMDLAAYVDSRVREIASMGAAGNESHLLVLTSLMLADEILDLKTRLAEASYAAQSARAQSGYTEQDEQIIVEAIDHLAGRIEMIAERIQKA